jgi:hypothetical protein
LLKLYFYFLKALETQMRGFQAMMAQFESELAGARAEAAKKDEVLTAFRKEMQETAKR